MELLNLTIGELFTQRVAQTPDEIAVEFEGETATWKEIDFLSDWLVYRFDYFGIKRNTRCAIWCGNHLQWVIVYLGLQKIGATAVLVNPGYTFDELNNVLSYAQIEYLFYGEQFKEQILTDSIDRLDLKDYAFLKQMIPIELEDAIDFMKKGAAALGEKEYQRIEEVKKLPKYSDVACMLFTSGTTARPKGVLLTHHNIVNTARATVAEMHWSNQDKFCVMVPLFHCFGMTSCLISSIVSGASLYLMKYYRTIDALDAIQNHGCTVLNGVPSMFLAMINNREFDKFNVSGLKSGIIAGSRISTDEYKEICKRLNLKHLQMSYGQTETSPGISFSQYDESIDEKADNAGFLIPGIEAKIVDKELVVKGFAVMKGYYNLPKETAEVLAEDGWLRTGDLASFDEFGHLRIEGRKKELIIRGGENISPVEIEERILELPQIKEVKIVGVPEPVLQEEIAAAVVLKKGQTITKEQIREHVRGSLAVYKVPKYILFLEDLPKTTSGKIATSKIKEIFEQGGN